jgi:flagellar hook-length control protein FliK
MSQVANATATPLIKALPQDGAQAKSKHHARSNADKSSTHPSFEEVKASLPRRPANQDAAKRHAPIDVAPAAETPPHPAKDGSKTPAVAKSHAHIGAVLVAGLPSQPARESNSSSSTPATAKSHTPTDTALAIVTPSQPASAGSNNAPVAVKPHTPTDTAPHQGRASISGSVQGNKADTATASGTASSSKVGSPSSSPALTPVSSEAALAVTTPSAGGTKSSAAANNSASASAASQLGLSRSSKSSAGEQPVTGRRPAPSSSLTAEVATTRHSSVSAKPVTTTTNFEVVASRSVSAHDTPPNGSVVQLNATSALRHLDNLPPASALAAAPTDEAVASTPLGQLGNVVAQVVREGNLPRTITIALEPKELGQLQLQVTSNGGDIQVHIQVADPTTRGMVNQQLADLTSALHRDLGFGGQQGGSRQESPQRSLQSSGSAVDLGGAAATDAPPESSTTSATHTLIDVRL